MTMVRQTRHGKQAPVKTAPAAPPERLGPGHYKVWSRTQPGVPYETRIDPATGERISCTCLAGANDRHCWHAEMARELESGLRATRTSDAAACEAVDAPSAKTTHAPSPSHFDPKTGEYTGPLAEAFDRPMRATRGGHR